MQKFMVEIYLLNYRLIKVYVKRKKIKMRYLRHVFCLASSDANLNFL